MLLTDGVTRTVMAIVTIVTEPFISALSDTLGRKHLMTWGRAGIVLFFAAHKFRDRSPAHRMFMEVFCWGVVQAGVWPVFAAAHSDLFGSRPELSSRIQAADGLWTNVIGAAGGVLTMAVNRAFGPTAGQEFCALTQVVSIVILQTIPETLAKAERKRFQIGEFLRRTNPFSNALLLFTKGPGLRRLSLSTLLFFCCNEVWATQTAFRMGVLGWIPMTISHFTSAYDLFGVVSQGTFGNRLLARMGNRASMEVGALISLVSYALQGLCMLPSGQAGQRTNIQYAIAISLLQTIPLSMKYASRAMVVKQGMVVYEGKVGRGQLNAAYSGLGTLCSIFANLLWGSAYQFFLSKRGPRWLHWGSGGHFFVTAGIMGVVYAAIKGADPATLFIADDEPEPEEKAGANP